MEALLREIGEHGWDPGLREAFVAAFDQMIGRAIVYHLARFRSLSGREIGLLLSSVEQREGGNGSPSEPLLAEVIEDAYVSVYQQVFQGTLIPAYLQGRDTGRIASDFSAYLHGVVRHRVLDCLRRQDRHLRVEDEDTWCEHVAEGEPNWSRAIRARWWDRLVRCHPSRPEERQDLRRICLSIEGEGAERMRLCLACAELKDTGTETERQDIRMFLVYYLSNHGTTEEATERVMPERGDISLEKIRGLALSWAEVFRIFGRHCNPTRIREELRRQYEEAP